MASRLKLRKKKFHPPLQESPTQSNVECNKTTEGEKDTNFKTYAQVTSSSTKNVDENEIFTRAIESAKKHQIKLKAGRRDRGYGNCAFEAVINNINDRACFNDKFVQSPNWYRWSWMNDMMERILMGICPWNLGYTEKQIREGFTKLQESGIYEVDFFGDMMMGGIACGIRRKILIFNTSENLLHDPISVVDPECYDSRIKIDTETPVVVVYNNYHYENLLPVDEQDRQETIRLVDSYIKDRYKEEYGFTKKDITYLISPSPRNTRQGIKCPQQDSAKSNTNSKLRAMYPGKIKQSKQSYNLVNQEVQNKKSKFESEGLEEQEKQPWTTVFSKQNQERKVENSQMNKQKTTCQPKIKKKSEEKLNSNNNQVKCLKNETDKDKQQGSPELCHSHHC